MFFIKASKKCCDVPLRKLKKLTKYVQVNMNNNLGCHVNQGRKRLPYTAVY